MFNLNYFNYLYIVKIYANECHTSKQYLSWKTCSLNIIIKETLYFYDVPAYIFEESKTYYDLCLLLYRLCRF